MKDGATSSDDDAAVIRGLRLRRNEAQLTQVIGEVAVSDRRFAADFVRAVVRAAAKNERHSGSVSRVREVPDELDCIAEHHLAGGEESRGLGFVDLAFQGEPDFTLFVENKLHSGYGHDQVKRYLTALDRLPTHRRSGLVAVTRNYPCYGEDQAVGHDRWLGSVRWASLLPELRNLEPVNERVTSQWSMLLSVLEEQGDLGVAQVKTELIEGWAHYLKGREHLADILSGLREHTLDVLTRELKSKHRGAGKAGVTEWKKGERQAVAVIRDQRSVWIGFSFPADAPEPCVVVQFDNTFDTPIFTVQAEPWRAHERLGERDSQFRRAAKQLESDGFKPEAGKERWWANTHGAATWLHEDDAQGTLARFIEEDVKTIVASGILKGELDAVRDKKVWGRLKRKRRSG